MLGIPQAREGSGGATQTLELYYASDVHGSDQCWRKFLGAGRFYEVNALIMGGDLTARRSCRSSALPTARSRAEFLGETRRGSDAGGARRATGASATTACTRGSRARTRSRATGPTRPHARELFEQVMLDELRRWVVLADERMAPLGIEVFVMAGNDDPWSCDAVLEARRTVVLRHCGRRGRRPRDDLVLVRQPDAVGEPARAERGRPVREGQGAGRSARAARDRDLQPARAAERVGPRHGLRDRRSAAHRRAQRQAARDPGRARPPCAR